MAQVKHREDVGVTLYGAQQQLAKLQLQLEQLHDGVKVVTRAREEADAKLVEFTGKSAHWRVLLHSIGLDLYAESDFIEFCAL